MNRIITGLLELIRQLLNEAGHVYNRFEAWWALNPSADAFFYRALVTLVIITSVVVAYWFYLIYQGNKRMRTIKTNLDKALTDKNETTKALYAVLHEMKLLGLQRGGIGLRQSTRLAKQNSFMYWHHRIKKAYELMREQENQPTQTTTNNTVSLVAPTDVFPKVQALLTEFSPTPNTPYMPTRIYAYVASGDYYRRNCICSASLIATTVVTLFVACFQVAIG